MYRVLVKAHTIITCSASNEVLRPGGAIIEDGVIVAIGPLAEIQSQGPFDRTIGDAETHIAIPGLVNGHHHSLRPNRPGRVSGPSEIALLQMRRRRLPSLSDAAIFDHTLWTAVSLLRSGVTSFVDCFPVDPRLQDFGLAAGLDAYLKSGIRVAVCPQISDRATFTYQDDDEFLASIPDRIRRSVLAKLRPTDHERYFEIWESMRREYDGREGRLRLGFGPTGPLWCTDALLIRLKKVARDHGAPLQLHLLQTPFEAIAAVHRYGSTEVRHLEEIDLLDELTSFAHAPWITVDEMHVLGDFQSAVIHNPAANLRGGSGIAPVDEMLRARVPVGLGLDASGLEPTFDMLREMRLAMLLQQRPGWNYDQVGPRDVLGMATSNAAYCLGLPTKVGRLEKGAAGDILLLNRDRMPMSPYADSERQSPEAVVVGSASASSIDHVIVNGLVMVQDGAVVGIDLDSLRDRVAKNVERYLPLLHEADAEFRQLRPYVDAYFQQFELQGYGINPGCYGFRGDSLRVGGSPVQSSDNV
jgi:5-methylthioadenosine/S-adenosylhomocysteine deaminase